ncbi:hypothetical protein DMA12_35995 [Amycolatopsis balhimycina DSM 5908]|uniref:Uncharacterized protein n=1 Tax=Amycolatopsis balhimycina DSM 5908 TaxID=1081091 RepID=A0A428W3I5_AMYBA|nr:hypothetical protein [Amycolatopsis balhimycina]RSM37638.1 hypothetical protein DMA12_35995 [Amycolatopsis balhimycina DSM 5908]
MGRIVKGALAVAAVTAGLAVGVPSTASATQEFVTPMYGMSCSTGVSGSLGSYWGSATCTTPAFAKWKVRVSCSFGFTTDSVYIITDWTDGAKTLYPPSSCYWGVNSVQVVESA